MIKSGEDADQVEMDENCQNCLKTYIIDIRKWPQHLEQFGFQNKKR